MEVSTGIAIMLFCLLLEGFFSGSEIGIVSADRATLVHRAAKGSRGAKLALQMLKEPEWLLSTTLVGTNIAVVTNTTIATALVISLLGEQYSWLAAVIVAPLIVIFGEIVPKSIFQQHADFITPLAIFPLRAAAYLFYPLLIVFTTLTRVLARLFGAAQQNPFTLREEILTMMQMPEENRGDIQPVEKEMIRRLFDFSETTVQQAMVPMIDVAAIGRNALCGEAVALASREAHVRLPVYDTRVVKVVGVLYTLDLLGVARDKPIRDHIRSVPYVPVSKSIHALLLEMRRERNFLAVVVDEFGGALGIVTMEDIMEEVVEDIEDEYDNEASSQRVHKLGERDYVVSARIEVDQLVEQLGISIPEGNYATLAGFLLERTHEVPDKGTVVHAFDMTFTVQRSTPQAIEEVRIRW